MKNILYTTILSFLFFNVLADVRAEGPSSQELHAKLNSDGQLIVATFMEKKPDAYPLCTRGIGAVRNTVIAITTYLASARKLKGEPWAAGNATQPYFEKLCEELAEAELEKELAEPGDTIESID
ncbi:MAG: hypothetical protein ABGY11_12270 [Candidatus Thioglobus sp.]|jgi:hypothetical protein